jgi:acyl-homoserine lactone acylase PvdQ
MSFVLIVVVVVVVVPLPLPLLLLVTVCSGESKFWRDQTREEFFARVLSQVSAELATHPERVIPWGERQQFVMHNVLFQGQFPFSFLDHGPMPMAGNRATVKQGQFFETMDGRVGTFAPSWRMVSDQKQYQMWTSLPGGPSGEPFSGLYSSQVQEW